MNCQENKQTAIPVDILGKVNKRFNRSRSKDNISMQKRAFSSCASEENFRNFYMKNCKFPKAQEFIEDPYEIASKNIQTNHYDFVVKRKQKTMTEKFNNYHNNINDKQKQDLIIQVQRLKAKNKDLEVNLKVLSNSFNQNPNKENRPMNKLRQKTQKQRIKQLQIQNFNLKQIIGTLKSDLKVLKDSKITQTTENKFQKTFQIQDQLEKNQKEIFNLNEDVRRLQLEIDFLNRRNHSEISIIKVSYQKQLKILRDKNQQLSKLNVELKKKNSQLKYMIKGTRQKKCSCFYQNKKTQKYQNLLQLSSD